MCCSPHHRRFGAPQWPSRCRSCVASSPQMMTSMPARGRDGVEVPGIDVARAEHEPLRDAVQFDQCKRRRQLVGCGEQNGFAGEVVFPTVKAGAGQRVGKADMAFDAADREIAA